MAKTKFEWDTEKDALNQEKHGVSFAVAQYAFADQRRVIAKDDTHSQTEERFYCFGVVDVRVIADFLPSPAELAFNEEAVKVTLALSKKSIDFFKSEAIKNHTQYQRMIRRLVDAYVESHSQS